MPNSTDHPLRPVIRVLPQARLAIQIAEESFVAVLRTDLAPLSCAWLASQLPLRLTMIHARWSGEACWAPLGRADLGLPHESATSHPLLGEVLLYGGGLSEPELLFPYGPSKFASKAGTLAGNPLLTFIDGFDRLETIGRRVLWEGATELRIEYQQDADGPGRIN